MTTFKGSPNKTICVYTNAKYNLQPEQQMSLGEKSLSDCFSFIRNPFKGLMKNVSGAVKNVFYLVWRGRFFTATTPKREKCCLADKQQHLSLCRHQLSFFPMLLRRRRECWKNFFSEFSHVLQSAPPTTCQSCQKSPGACAGPPRKGSIYFSVILRVARYERKGVLLFVLHAPGSHLFIAALTATLNFPRQSHTGRFLSSNSSLQFVLRAPTATFTFFIKTATKTNSRETLAARS